MRSGGRKIDDCFSPQEVKRIPGVKEGKRFKEKIKMSLGERKLYRDLPVHCRSLLWLVLFLVHSM